MWFDQRINLTTILSHVISGGLAITVLSRNQKKLQRNQILMTIVAMIAAQINTAWIISKIEKPTD